jgi:tripartite-type tricarboxylate transporter receptor subunit TctC
MHRLARTACIALGFLTCAPFAWSQPWPAKPLRLVVNVAPGGG